MLDVKLIFHFNTVSSHSVINTQNGVSAAAINNVTIADKMRVEIFNRKMSIDATN